MAQPQRRINHSHARTQTVTQETLKKKYIKLVDNFRELEIENEKMSSQKQPVNPRISAIYAGSIDEGKEILSMKDETALLKKLEEEMAKALEEALCKNVLFFPYPERNLLCLHTYVGLCGSGSSSLR